MFYNMYLPLVSESNDLIIPVLNSTSNISFKLDFGKDEKDFLFKDYSNIDSYLNKEIEYELNYFKMCYRKYFDYLSKMVSIINDDIELLYIISLSKALLNKEDNRKIFEKVILKMDIPEIGYSYVDYQAFYKKKSFHFCGSYLCLLFDSYPVQLENRSIDIIYLSSSEKIKINSINKTKNGLFGLIEKNELSLIKEEIKLSRNGILLI